MATQATVSHGQKGISDGLETDTNGFIYCENQEDSSVIVFNPANGTVNVFARDPRMSWTDSLSVASDGYLRLPRIKYGGPLCSTRALTG